MAGLGSSAQPSPKLSSEGQPGEDAGPPRRQGAGPAPPELRGLKIGLLIKNQAVTTKIRENEGHDGKTTPVSILLHRRMSPLLQAPKFSGLKLLFYFVGEKYLTCSHNYFLLLWTHSHHFNFYFYGCTSLCKIPFFSRLSPHKAHPAPLCALLSPLTQTSTALSACFGPLYSGYITSFIMPFLT